MERCPYCSFDPTSLSDYCDEHRPFKRPKSLFKTTIVIWTDYDPYSLELDELAREAVDGDGYCSEQKTEQVSDPGQFPATDFFDKDE